MKAPGFWFAAPGLAAALLSPASAAWVAASRLRRARARPWRAPVPVICVGNLVAGGQGKTPVVVSLIGRLRERGFSPHAVSRGYGGRLKGPLKVDPTRHLADEVGDEPLLIARAGPTWVARDRVAGVKAAVDAGAGLVVLDDGLQNPSLEKDLSLVVVDGAVGFGNGRVIPAGPLREPVEDGLARAGAVVLMTPDSADVRAQAAKAGVPVLSAAIVPAAGTGGLRGLAVVAFAGIGRPDKFFQTLERLGARIVGRHAFADHATLTPDLIMRLVDEATDKAAVLVTTEKDHVRLPAEARPMVQPVPVIVAWEDPAALDRLLDRVVGDGG